MELPLFILSFLSLHTFTTARKPSNAVPLSDIKSLTFHDGKMTTSRRVDPIPQISCAGGSAAGLFTPSSIRCVNAGSSYSTSDIEWTCTASLPPEFKLGSTDVVCEGYESAEDDYVLKGSCGVEYRLVLTQVGEEKYGKGGGWGGKRKGKSGGEGMGDDAVAWGFWIIFVGVVGWMAYTWWTNRAAGGVRRPPTGRGVGWGGGGDDGHDDPPPPYDAYPPKPGPSASTYYRQATAPRTRAPRQQQQGWRPGFWTGAAAGAAGSWLAGRSGGTRQQSPQMAQRPSRPAASEPGPSYSSERYTSTGFGSTSRR